MLNKPGPSATSGEKSFYNRIEHIISQRNDIIGYVEPGIGGSRPDFLLLSPNFGVIIVEIKDYAAEYLKEIQKSGNWETIKEEKPEFIRNPFDQIYQYWRQVVGMVNFCKFPKEIKVPILQLVCFSQISKEHPYAEAIRKICPERVFVFFKEALDRNIEFETALNDILPVNFHLSEEYFKIMRGNIVPSCRLPTIKQANLDSYFTAEDRVKLLDQEQERMMRKLGEGHRLIFGVAGSGKTVLLISRARFLAKKHPDWSILILCYNRLLRDLLVKLLIPQDYKADITVNTYHAWARDYILSANNEFSQMYKDAQQKSEREGKKNEFFQKFVPEILLQMLESLGDQKVFYDAILIDEAQDFEQNWFKAIIEVLNSEVNSFLITCDGIQGIYARKKFHWSSVGIQARGRSKRFEKSYRNPIEIGYAAQKALPNSIRELLGSSDEFLSTKEFIGDHGSVELIISESREKECRALSEKIAQLLKQPQMILLLFRYNMTKKNYNHRLFTLLRDLNVTWRDLEKYNYETPGLFVGTLHGTKGLECDTIIIPEINTFTSDADRQLLYVGFTRSRKKLILSAHESTTLVESLKEHHISET